MDIATIDTHRELRCGAPEVIYCEGKRSEETLKIIDSMMEDKKNILATRIDTKTATFIRKKYKNLNYNEMGRILSIINRKIEYTKSYIAIVCAGTSDLPVVEEAYETALFLGNKVEKIIDVGVAGIHRLINKIEVIRKARVVIVVAGMDGALASVVGGLVDIPVIAVPTSIGYGTAFGGVAPLLTMLNSCASGVTVVNIDNGFGAAYAASLINHLK